ncbi:MAG: 3-deoxy-manno-octulosonate cytidylyltransferase [Pseudomonadota bacterium]
MTVHVVIPSRRVSSRLPDKALADIGGTPMVVHVLRLAESAAVGDVCVATDDTAIASAIEAAGGKAELTRVDHTSGTDRAQEVAARRKWPDNDVVVNVQGDEPLLPPALISQVAELLLASDNADIATLATPLGGVHELTDPNVVKVVTDDSGRAMYFSRAPIPHGREDSAAAVTVARRHLGLYAYRVGVLHRLVQTPPATLEQLERLEQLRALALGMTIVVADAVRTPGPGVDTPDDLARVRQLVAGA